MKRIVLLLSILFCFSILTAQNLVQNSGFEDYYECPTEFNTSKANRSIAPFWFSPSDGTPDLFNHCSENSMTGVSNFAGVVNALEGSGFAGIISWKKDGFREYLSTKLTSSLIKDTKYTISFRYRLATYSMYATDRMGFLLSVDSISLNHDHVLEFEATHTRKRVSPLDEETGTWQTIKYEYLAKGEEQFLSIGNFSPPGQTAVKHMYWNHVQNPMLKEAAYYYIDEVLVGVINEDSVKTSKEDNEFHLASASPIALTELRFDHDKATIKPSSYPQLDRLVEYLSKNQSKISITGHTDQSGNEVYNQKLSEQRAGSVANYLKYSGVSPKRIQTKGEGSNFPLSTTDLKMNRRVEILLKN